MKSETILTLVQWSCAGIVVLGVGAWAVRGWSARPAPERAALEALEPLLTVDGSAPKESGRASVVFRVKNAGRRTVKITDVSTTCSCLAPAGLAGTSLSAGSELPLDVQVSVPELGSMAQRLLVFHDGPGSPLALSVMAKGRRQLPVLDTVENGFPLFDDLRDPAANQTIVVNTFEEVNAQPWLGELTTAHPNVKFMPSKIEEAIDQRAGFTRRRYHFTIGWDSLPLEREVRTPIYAKTAIDPDPGLLIGSVAAIVRRRHFSPTTVLLVRGKMEEDWVVFTGDEDSPEPWEIAKATPLPKWLAAEWQSSDGQVRLHLALASGFEEIQPERVQLSLVNGRGERELLTVVAYPAK